MDLQRIVQILLQVQFGNLTCHHGTISQSGQLEGKVSCFLSSHKFRASPDNHHPENSQDAEYNRLHGAKTKANDEILKELCEVARKEC